MRFIYFVLFLIVFSTHSQTTTTYCNPNYTKDPSLYCRSKCGECCAYRNGGRMFPCCEYTGSGGECTTATIPHDKTEGPDLDCVDGEHLFICAYTNDDIITCNGRNQSDPLVCTGHGECKDTGACVCELGYGEAYCSVRHFIPGVDWMTFAIFFVPIFLVFVFMIIIAIIVASVCITIKYNEEQAREDLIKQGMLDEK